MGQFNGTRAAIMPPDQVTILRQAMHLV